MPKLPTQYFVRGHVVEVIYHTYRFPSQEAFLDNIKALADNGFEFIDSTTGDYNGFEATFKKTIGESSGE